MKIFLAILAIMFLLFSLKIFFAVLPVILVLGAIIFTKQFLIISMVCILMIIFREEIVEGFKNRVTHSRTKRHSHSI